jgi:hypothetical protein
MQQRRKRRILSRVAEITGSPQRLIRYHVERGHVPIRHRPDQIRYCTDAEIRLTCEDLGVSSPEELSALPHGRKGVRHETK